MSLQDDVKAAGDALRQWFTDNAPQLAAGAEGVINDLESAGKTAADAAVEKAAPAIAPEVLPTLNSLLNKSDTDINAQLAADINALQVKAADAKAANAATRAAINPAA